MLDLDGVETIIFDLGGVIIDLDFQRTFDQLALLSGKSPANIQKGMLEDGLLLRYEQGLFTDEQFIEALKKTFEFQARTEEIEAAFIALLLHVPPARIKLIRELSRHYRLFLLSNTSAMHYRAVNHILRSDTGCEHLSHLFEKVFLSYEMGLLKPEKEIYQAVLQEAALNPQRTLFLDDNASNLAGASSMGIQTCLVSSEQSILSLFHYE